MNEKEKLEIMNDRKIEAIVYSMESLSILLQLIFGDARSISEYREIVEKAYCAYNELCEKAKKRQGENEVISLEECKKLEKEGTELLIDQLDSKKLSNPLFEIMLSSFLHWIVIFTKTTFPID